LVYNFCIFIYYVNPFGKHLVLMVSCTVPAHNVEEI